MAVQRPPRRGPTLAAAATLGFGMGGFLDGIVLHQILQWHQMISSRLPPTTLEAKNVNMFWDGVFHLATWTATAAGVALLWRTAIRGELWPSTRALLGGWTLGWGVFNLLDSVANHYVFRLHDVRENVENPAAWNLGFLLLALLLIAVGGAVAAKAPRPLGGAGPG